MQLLCHYFSLTLLPRQSWQPKWPHAKLDSGPNLPWSSETEGGRRLTPPTHLISFISHTYAMHPCDDTEACCYLQ